MSCQVPSKTLVHELVNTRLTSNADSQINSISNNKAFTTYKDELNIFKNDMDSINKHQWWKELEQSWSDKSKTLKQCAKWCTQKEEENE